MSQSIKALQAMLTEGITLTEAASRFGISRAAVSKAKLHPSKKREMTKTIEQLQARVRELEADLAAARQIIDEENRDHIEQLAASQLSNQQLREALHYSLGAWHYDGVSDEHGSIFKEANDRCDTQPSTEALDAYVSEKVKEAMK